MSGMTLTPGRIQEKTSIRAVETRHRQQKRIETLVRVRAIHLVQLQSRNLRQTHNLIGQSMYCSKTGMRLKAVIHWIRCSAQQWYRRNDLCLWKDVGNRNQNRYKYEIISYDNININAKPYLICLFLKNKQGYHGLYGSILTIERTTDPNGSSLRTHGPMARLYPKC